MGRENGSYAVRMIGLALGSAGLAVAASYLERAGLVPQGLRPVVAVLPVLPLVWLFIGISRWLGRLDELQRMIHLEAMVIQFAATGILVMSYGMLAKAGVVPDFRTTQAFPFVWMAIFGFWTVGFLLVRRKYR